MPSHPVTVHAEPSHPALSHPAPRGVSSNPAPARRLRRRVLPLALSALMALPLAACSSQADGPELRVVTTVAPITSIASAVAGDRATIEGLVPEGTNSHTFEPPPSAAKALAKADVILINGLKLEDPTLDLAEQNKQDKTPIVEIGTEVLPQEEYLYDFSFPESEGKPNPHLWTDPTWAIKYAAQIRDTLTKADPDGEDTYAANYAKFEAQATDLSEALKQDQATIPNGRKVLLTYHDAYAYFAKTYGWTVIGAIQPKDFGDPSLKEITKLISQVKAEQVPAIFGSEVFPSDALAEIGKATGASYTDTLRDDDLPAEPGADEHSWAGLMRSNYVTMIEALGGKAPRLAEVDVAPTVPDRATYPQ